MYTMNPRRQRDRRMEKEQVGGGRWLKPEPEAAVDSSGGGDDGEDGRNLNYYYDQGKEICSGRRRFHGGREQQQQLQKLSAELSKEPLRRPGAIPFLWEQSPGKRKSPPPTTLRQLFRQSTDAAAASAVSAAAAAASAPLAADLSYDFSETCSFVSAADDARSFASGSEVASDEAAAAAASSRLFLLHRFLPAAHAVAKPAPDGSRRDSAAWPNHGFTPSAAASRRTISDAIASPEAFSDVDSDDDSIPASPSSGACAGFLALRIFRFRNSDSMGVAAAAAARLSSCASFSLRRSHRHRRALRQLAHYREAQRSSPSFPSFTVPNRYPPTPDSTLNTDGGAAAMSGTIKDVLHCGSSSADLLLPASSLAESPPTSSSRSSVSSCSYVYNSPKLVVMEINQEINSNIHGMSRRSSRADLMADGSSDQGRAVDGMKSVYSSSTSSSRSSRTNYCSMNTGISSPNYSNWSSNSNVCSLAAAVDEDEDGVSSKISTTGQRSAPAPPPLPKSPTQSWLMQSVISGKAAAAAAAIRSPSRLAQMQRASPVSPHSSARMNGVAHLQSSRWDPLMMNESQRLQRFPQDLLQQQQPNTLRIGA